MRPDVEPGTFRPAPPGDSQEVLWLFAIAARAACARPEALDDISRTLAAAVEHLVPPEKLAAEECARLWGLFVRVARIPKPALRTEAGRALYRDLESIGQRLDLPPLADWDAIPAAVETSKAVRPSAPAEGDGTTVDEIRARARRKAKKKGASGPPLRAQEVLALLTSLSAEARERLYAEVIGGGALPRSDTQLVERVVASGEKIKKEDELLVEVLETVGRWLVK